MAARDGIGVTLRPHGVSSGPVPQCQRGGSQQLGSMVHRIPPTGDMFVGHPRRGQRSTSLWLFCLDALLGVGQQRLGQPGA